MEFLKDLESGNLLIVGHYGCGKTNLSINLALELASQGKKVALVDLDIVNPYFRASDSRKLLEDAGIEVVAPTFAGTTLDSPSLPPAISNAIDAGNLGKQISIIDVGGDPDGAMALGRYRNKISAADYMMLYVVNQRRLQTQTAQEALELLGEIQQISRLSATHIVANTHLGQDTSAEVIQEALPFAHEVASEAGLPLAFITATRRVADEVEADVDIFPVDVHVKTPWM